MSYKIGDIVWYENIERECVITNRDLEYVELTNSDTGRTYRSHREQCPALWYPLLKGDDLEKAYRQFCSAQACDSCVIVDFCSNIIGKYEEIRRFISLWWWELTNEVKGNYSPKDLEVGDVILSITGKLLPVVDEVKESPHIHINQVKTYSYVTLVCKREDRKDL